MIRAKTDVITALVLLGFCLVMLYEARQIKDLGFAGIKPEAWPLLVLWGLTATSVIYLIRSVIAWRRQEPVTDSDAPGPGFGKYVNALWCFGLFMGFLLTLDYLGMLLGGILFVFLLFSVLGGVTPRKLLLHALVAIVAIGIMWSIFVFGLGVVLPQGEILRFM